MLDFDYKADFEDQFAEQLNNLIDQFLVRKQKNKKERSYLGASRLGVNCSRLLQYEYQHVPKDKSRGFSGQVLRIFEAGHLFEELAIDWLRGAGFELLTHNKDGNQFGFEAANGKIAGHVDGIIISAPDSLNMQTPAIWEMKSMNNRNWKATNKKSLKIQNPIYAAQIALYQAYMEESFTGISTNPALFTAINKDTAELYHELISFDVPLAQRMSDKAVNIIKASQADELMPRVASSPDYFECKYCSYQDRCWNLNNKINKNINEEVQND